jgi:hypothetical protein
LNKSEQLFASKYRLVLPSEEELRQEIERDRQTLAAYWGNKDDESKDTSQTSQP